MADTLNKPKLQLRSSFNTNGNDKTPSPATKLLISHGKPNFTIQKTPKENGTASNPLSPQINNLNNNNNNDSFVNKNNENNIVNNNNNNYNPYKTASVVKSTKFNGIFNAASVNIANNKAQSESNEATKVVLRKVAKPAEPELREGEDENVPEFIRRQRRIQERLAKENVLDFENRRSGYFTHVMITPTSPNRTSFSETMASPAVVPSLEMPAPQTQESVQEETEEEVTTEQHAEPEINNQTNGHVNTPEEEEEVAKAIEEVNKAVAGEDDASGTEQAEEQEQPEEPQVQPEEPEEVVTAVGEVEAIEVPAVAAPVAQARALNETDEMEQSNGDVAVETVTHEHIEANVEIKAEAIVEEVVTKAEQVVASMEHSETNGHAAEHAEQNGHASSETENVTISHTNGVQDGPHIPAPDPSGALGVNYEPKTVVSFSKDLGADANKYPDTVVVQKEVESGASIDPALQEIAKLKFDIKADDADDVQVTPVLRTE